MEAPAAPAAYPPVTDLIPHRPPFLFVDRVEGIAGTRIVASRHIRPDEPFFAGHYPGRPIMPGCLICESIFQTGAILMGTIVPAGTPGVPVVTRVDHVKLRKMLGPGDTLTIEVELLERMGSAYRFKGKASSGGKVSVSCEFLAALVADGAGDAA